MISIILRSCDLDGLSWQSTSVLSFHDFVCTVYRCVVELFKDWPNIMVKNVYALGRVNISFYICVCAHSIYTNTPNIFQTHVLHHYDFHTILKIVCSTFSRIFATHADVNLSLTPPAFNQKILLYSIVLVLFSIVYFGTLAHDFFFIFQWNCQCCLLNRLWIDLLQIGTGTERLNPFIIPRKLRLRSRFTRLINECSPCLLVDLGRSVRGFFSIFSCWSNLLKNVDTVDRLYTIIFPISVCLIRLDVSVLPAVFG